MVSSKNPFFKKGWRRWTLCPIKKAPACVSIRGPLPTVSTQKQEITPEESDVRGSRALGPFLYLVLSRESQGHVLAQEKNTFGKEIYFSRITLNSTLQQQVNCKKKGLYKLLCYLDLILFKHYNQSGRGRIEHRESFLARHRTANKPTFPSI